MPTEVCDESSFSRRGIQSSRSCLCPHHVPRRPPVLSFRCAKRANLEEGIDGRFFQGRFKAVRLEDQEAMLACNVYVDLNLIRAGIAQTIEGSDFTSGKMRAEMLKNPDSPISQNSFITPIELQEKTNPTPCTSRSQKRCSDKGVLPISELDYLELLDLTARSQKEDQQGFTPPATPPILERLGIDWDYWKVLTQNFGKLFSAIAGNAKTLSEARSLVTGQQFQRKQLFG